MSFILYVWQNERAIPIKWKIYSNFHKFEIFFVAVPVVFGKVQSQKPFTIEINNQQYYSQIRTSTVIIELMTLLNFKYEKKNDIHNLNCRRFIIYHSVDYRKCVAQSLIYS